MKSNEGKGFHSNGKSITSPTINGLKIICPSENGITLFLWILLIVKNGI
jgi:hypothetical protein